MAITTHGAETAQGGESPTTAYEEYVDGLKARGLGVLACSKMVAGNLTHFALMLDRETYDALAAETDEAPQLQDGQLENPLVQSGHTPESALRDAYFVWVVEQSRDESPKSHKTLRSNR